MKKLLTSVILLLGAFQATAQQDAMFTHYAFNTLAVNPAYAGNREMMSATILHRSQWIGFEGAPMTQTLTVNTPLSNGKLGLGVSLQNDRIGPLNVFTANLDFAYRMKINANNKLAFGIKAGTSIYNHDLQSLISHETGDALIDNSTRNDAQIDLGVGLLYTNKKFYVGVSLPKLFANTFRHTDVALNELATNEVQHYYFTAGTMLTLSKQLELRPSTFVKANYGAPIEVDLTAMFVINKKLELGGMWRTNDAVGILAGYTFMENLRVGYSFDWSYGLETGTYHYGSHELMLRYDLFYKGSEDIVSPRYF